MSSGLKRISICYEFTIYFILLSITLLVRLPMLFIDRVIYKCLVFFPEPYNFHRRRGQKQPQVMATASMKRLYVENRPYIVSGYCQNRAGNHTCSESLQPVVLSDVVQQEAFGNVYSMVEKYTSMKATFRKRLTFGEFFSFFYPFSIA